nr:hypothetical protein [Variovorax paradoxus]
MSTIDLARLAQISTNFSLNVLVGTVGDDLYSKASSVWIRPVLVADRRVGADSVP